MYTDGIIILNKNGEDITEELDQIFADMILGRLSNE